MADYGRNDMDERRGPTGAVERGRERGGSIFGSDWSGRDGDRDRGRDNDRDRYREGGRGGSPAGGWFDQGRTLEDDRRELKGSDRGGRREREFGYDDRHEGLPIDETGRLIASNKVEGTAVYSRDGQRLGSIYNFMVDKVSGQVEYAVMAYGGFLGMGQRYYPLPWRVLTYQTDAGGYVIDMRARDFEDAPSFGRDDEPEFDREYGRRVHSWYGLNY